MIERYGEELSASSCEALWDVAATDRARHVRLAAALAAGGGGKRGFAALPSREPWRPGGSSEDGRDRFRCIAREAWALPRLAGSGACPEALPRLKGLRENLVKLPEVDRVGAEASLAQGFKYEANRILAEDDGFESTARGKMMGEAKALLREAASWYTEMTLIQALTLWSLPRSDTSGAVEKELDGWARPDQHPFVAEAIELGARAARTGEPSRYVWLDEATVVSRLGPTGKTFETSPKARQWVSPAAGWLSLAPEARRLLGEVVLLLNLGERQEPDPLVALHSVSLSPLPACVSVRGARGYLIPDPEPATPKTCHDRCSLSLCPYPPKGEPVSRGEFSEAFCRAQQRRHRRPAGGRARWQAATRRELWRFWRRLEKRAAQRGS